MSSRSGCSARQSPSDIPHLTVAEVRIVRLQLPHLVTNADCCLVVGQKPELINARRCKHLGNGAAIGQRTVAEVRVHDVEPASRETRWDYFGAVWVLENGKQLVPRSIERLSTHQILRIPKEFDPIVFVHVAIPVRARQIGNDVRAHDRIERHELADMSKA